MSDGSPEQRGRHGAAGRMTFDRFGILLGVAYGFVVFMSLRYLFHTPLAGAVLIAVASAAVGAVLGPW